jgi:hypothetical protein
MVGAAGSNQTPKVTTTKLVFDANNGRLGLNTNTITYQLDVLGGAAGATTSVFNVRSNGTTNNTGTTIRISNSTGPTAPEGTSEITSFRTNTGTSGATDLIFSTSTGGSVTEKIRVKADGNVGIATTTPGYTLEVNGSFAATTKSFVINHPTKPGKKLRYGSLEGPENGVYIRGRLTNSNVIELPEYWTKLVDHDSITVNLTPIGSCQKLFVESVAIDKVTIKNENMFSKTIDCYYTIFAERNDVDKLEVEI